nr:L,D-transpeptidase [Pararhizobium sp. IMCC3301]
MRRLFLAIALILTSSAVVPFGNGGAEARQVFDPASRTWRDIGRSTRAGKSKIKRKLVRYQTKEKPGTIIINTSERRLYHVQGNGKAMRYGVGVGRVGFQWSGVNRVSRKAEWPGWTPPAAMRKRQPGLPAYMPGGINNPLGARALYIGSTIYRIHGSNEPTSIGQAVSSGCIRLTNEDVKYLYERVKVGTKVIVVR